MTHSPPDGQEKNAYHTREKVEGTPEPDLEKMDKECLTQFDRHERCFPPGMRKEAFRGLAGEVVGVIEANNEPCKEALLAQLMVGIGSMCGRWVYRHQGSRHHLNEFALLVGETAVGRKGTAWRAVLNLLEQVDDDWTSRVRNGFQSGESIIHAVRDDRVHYSKPSAAGVVKKTTVPGISDKRLMILEEEFARLLMVASRQGNIISTVARNAWDGAPRLYVEGKLMPEIATGAHISMIGHVTISELLSLLRRVENENGFSNRILFIASKRWQQVAEPEWIDWLKSYPEIVRKLKDLLSKYGASPARPMHWSKDGSAAWHAVYYSMGNGSGGGIVGPIIARSDAHLIRLTMLYAILDDSLVMRPEHLESAMAFWDYCKRSAQWVFGEATGNKNADKLYWALQHEENGLTREQIVKEVFYGNTPKNDVDMALRELVKAELVTVRHEINPPAKRPTQRWLLTERQYVGKL